MRPYSRLGKWPIEAAGRRTSRLVALREKDDQQPVVLWTDVNNQGCKRDGQANPSIQTRFVSYLECNGELTPRQPLPVWPKNIEKLHDARKIEAERRIVDQHS
ncbi:hypothetical protein [Mesorhizobium sp. LNHC232B00]|uniref:hypothetical protein n=1 Tax=Mesorhizobium sp. LNHC232B00 TaxID=1287243 RepID=UPI0018DB36E8|nr:hypothetical protein [Mesorhizobium sp. LNHC232B00]